MIWQCFNWVCIIFFLHVDNLNDITHNPITPFTHPFTSIHLPTWLHQFPNTHILSLQQTPYIFFSLSLSISLCNTVKRLKHPYPSAPQTRSSHATNLSHQILELADLASFQLLCLYALFGWLDTESQVPTFSLSLHFLRTQMGKVCGKRNKIACKPEFCDVYTYCALTYWFWWP